MNLLPLLLIPLCAVLNHEGGQNTSIPDPRIVFRVILIPIAYAVLAYFSGIDAYKVSGLWAVATLGVGLFAIPGWASGFCCIGPPYRDGRQDTWLAGIVNRIMGVNPLTKLTQDQIHVWGMIYFTLRGLYLYPLFIALGWLLTPWALLIGPWCALMGIVYGWLSTEVYDAEFKMGALIGIMLAATILVS